ncbi:unannotated protein [freshwater metagenome]|uniref:Unannotated protein n=1 Tax=freshwater metagenome TaxID=449393 RepID=A0A6J6LJA8_9ZZZZ
MTSLGRWDVPESAFSAHISRAVTLTLGLISGIAATTHSTAAAPDISLFMAIMVSYGRLREMPPVSKVMPLPTKTTCGQFLEPFGA